MQNLPESFFIKRLKSGDEKAYREAVKIYSDRVYNVILGLVQNQLDAEDLTQDVFVEMFRSIGSFRGDSALSTWVYRLALQKGLEYHRKSSRLKRKGFLISLFGKEKEVLIPAEAPFYHPGIKLENKERSAILFKAVSGLPEKQQGAFILHKVEGLSHAEIASVMKISVSAVESLIFRAKEKLKIVLSDYYEKNER